MVVVYAMASNAQDSFDPEKTFYDAEFHIIYKRYEEALPLYLSLVDSGINSSNIQYKIGFSLFHIPGKKQEAIPYLEKAARNSSWESRGDRYEEIRASKESKLYLGMAYQVNNKLSIAKEEYLALKEEASMALKNYNNKPLLAAKINEILILTDKAILSCDLAGQMQDSPIDLDLRNAHNLNIGTRNNSPSLSGDGNTMVFISKRQYYNAICLANKLNGIWDTPKNITMELESDGKFIPTSLSYDGKSLLMIHKEDLHYDIYESEFDNNRWHPVSPLSINSIKDEIHACKSPDGKTLYFVSDRRGGLGGFDIYSSTLDIEGRWSDPKNLGQPVNTPYDEHTPYLSEDGNMLYFSSTGHQGMGGFDIFSSRKNEDDSWSTPENIGYPVNTTDDDLHFSPVTTAENHPIEFGYMARFDSSGQNIYEIEFYSEYHSRKAIITGKVEIEEGQIIPDEGFDVTLINAANEDTLLSYPVKHSNGEYLVRIDPGDYILVFEKEGYGKVSDTISILPDKIADPVEHNASLTKKIESLPAEKDKAAFTEYIYPVYFVFDEYDFSKTATRELENIFHILQKDTTINLVVIGHTDSHGSKSYNLSLSKKRAQAVYNYLIKKGIETTQIRTNWQGESQPIVKNRNPDGTDNPDGRRLNRKVDFSFDEPVPVKVEIRKIKESDTK